MATSPGIIGNALNTPVVDPNNPAPTTPSTNAVPTSTTPPPATPGAPANAADYTPTAWNVDADQTVAGQVAKLVDPNNPIIQQARSQALRQSNDRGLLNSSMAMTGADDAAYRAAIPIAQADAGIKAQAAATNASETNKINQLAFQQQGDLARIEASGKVQKDLASFSAEAAKELAGIESTYKNLTQASSSAASIMNSTIQAISRIMEDPSLSAAGKQAAIDTYNTNAKISLQIIGSLAGDVDLGKFMDGVLA